MKLNKRGEKSLAGLIAEPAFRPKLGHTTLSGYAIGDASKLRAFGGTFNLRDGQERDKARKFYVTKIILFLSQLQLNPNLNTTLT